MIFKNARLSTMAYVTGLINPCRAQFPVMTDLVYCDFETHGDITTIPKGTAVGISAFGWTDMINFYNVMIGINCMTLADTNGMNVIDLASYFYEAFRPGVTFPVLDATSQTQIGQIIFASGTTVNPIQLAEYRAIQQIMAFGKLMVPGA